MKVISLNFIFKLLLLFSCQSNSPDNQETTKPVNITFSAASNMILSDTITKHFLPPSIDYQDFEEKTISISLSFTPEQVMKTIFGKNYFYVLNDPDTIKTALWKNQNFPLKSIPNTYSEEKFFFPDSSLTYDTRYLKDTIWANSEGKKYALISFSTSPIEYADLALVGRFSCAFLGVALFEQKADSFQLIDKNLGIGCYGAYSHAPLPSLVKIGAKKYALLIEQVNGGAGGPYYGVMFLHSLDKRNQLLFSESLTSRTMGVGSSWHSKIVFDSLSNKEMYDFKLITKGELMRDSFENIGESIDGLPLLLRNLMKKKDLTSFTWIREYTFKNGSYATAAERIE
jgi:hypothetical protein